MTRILPNMCRLTSDDEFAMNPIAPPAQAECPQEPPEAPVTPTPQPGRVGPQTEVEGAQEEPDRVDLRPTRVEAQEAPERPWWRRVLGV